MEAKETNEANEPQENSSNQFGMFGGVFTPSILTILGVIMFMRAGFVTGQAGIFQAILILLLAKSITFFTSLSISAISTNMRVRGGGAYFMISRSLGPESGGAIGVALFFAQAISVPFYILGFVEAMVRAIPAAKEYFMLITLVTALVLFIVNAVGASWAIKLQYGILAVLIVAIIVFLGGALLRFDVYKFQENWSAGYTAGNNFWIIFAIYFPAVTGIMTGVNMSGDLKDPMKAIPQGTLLSVFVGGAVYFVQILICGGSQARVQLIEAPFRTLMEQALFGLDLAVVAGVFAATLSSALGSFLGAPRILQALSRDEIFPVLRPFAHGTEKGDEPVRGLWLTFGLTLLVLLFVGNDSQGGALNIVAAVLSMFFLYTYGITNIAAFIESASRNPSFRPRFRFFHWVTALLGAVGCLGAAFLIDTMAALVALGIILTLYAYVRRRVLTKAFGDARRGFYFARVKDNLFRLKTQPHHPKNWRPTTLVLSGNPNTRLPLTKYAVWLESGRGIVTLARVVVGDVEQVQDARREALEGLEEFIEEHEIQAFPEVLVTSNFDQGMSHLLQAHSIGPLKPNLLMLGWPQDPKRVKPFVKNLRLARELGMSIVLTMDKGLPDPEDRQRCIDVWWRGKENGSLMLILSYLLSLNWDWSRAKIRILRRVEDESMREEAAAELQKLAEAARIDATIVIAVSSDSFSSVLHEYSQDATVVLLGFVPPNEMMTDEFHAGYSNMLEQLPTTLLIHSSGDADLLA